MVPRARHLNMQLLNFRHACSSSFQAATCLESCHPDCFASRASDLCRHREGLSTEVASDHVPCMGEPTDSSSSFRLPRKSREANGGLRNTFNTL